MDVFVSFDSLLHYFVDIVDILGDIFAHVGVQGQLVFFEFALLLSEQSPCLLQILVEVEPHSFF